MSTPSGRVLVSNFSISGEPISKSRARFTNRGSKTVAYTPQKTKDGEHRIALVYRSGTKGIPTDNEVAFRVEAEFHCGTRQRRDIDNMVKLVLDALNGVAWVDDNQVLEVEASKSYTAKESAHTTVRVYEIGRLSPPKAPCIRCGTEFRTYDSWKNNPGGKKYCSRECAYAHRVEQRKRACKECAAEFLAWGATHETKYCSRECLSASKRATVRCTHCDVEFTKQRCHVRKSNYCSEQCQATAAKIRRTKYMQGQCRICGAGTTRKEYTRCNACRLAGKTPAGAPR